MKLHNSSAKKFLFAEKTSSLLIIIAIIIATMLLMILHQSISTIQESRKEQAKKLNGDRYATFLNLTREEAFEIAKQPEFVYSGVSSSIGFVSPPQSRLSIVLYEFYDQASDIYTWSQVTEGRLPTKEREIALSQEALHSLEFQGGVGHSLTLPVEIGNTFNSRTIACNFELVGILTDTYLGYISGVVPGIVGEGSTEYFLPSEFQSYSVDIRTYNHREFQSIIEYTLKLFNKPAESVQYNEILLDVLRISYPSENAQSNSNLIALIGSVLIIIILIGGASGLVIYNILKIIFTKNLTYYGTFKALGAEKHYIRKLIYHQIIILLLVGVPIGICLGILASRYATTLVASMLFSDASAGVIENTQITILPIFLSALIPVLSAFLLGIPLVRYISQVSPIVAINQTSLKITERKSRIQKPRHFLSFYARLNLKRNKSKTYITVGSLSLSTALLLVAIAMTNTLNISESVATMYLGDYEISNISKGLDGAFVEAITDIEGLEYLYSMQFKKYHDPPFSTNAPLQVSDSLQIISLDAYRTDILLSNVSVEKQQAFAEGDACVISHPFAIFEDEQGPYDPLQIGDLVSIDNFHLEVIKINETPISILDSTYNGLQIIVSTELFGSITGEDTFTILQPDFSNTVDFHVIEEMVSGLVSLVPETYVISYEKTNAELSEAFYSTRILIISFVCFIFLIGILNVINSTYTNIYTRRREIGICRALGMSLHKVIVGYIWESFYISLYASFWGGLIGFLSSRVFSLVVGGSMIPISLFLVSLGFLFLITFISCAIATYIPIKLFIKTTVVDQIKSI